MSLLTADRVKETTGTNGTGTVDLDGVAVGAFDTFVNRIGNGNQCYYCIAHQSAAEYEIGVGTVTSGTPDTLSRDVILESSNADAAVNFSVGTKDVFVTTPSKALGMWTAWTPTGTWTTNATYTGWYRVLGDTLEVRANVRLSGAPGGTSVLRFNPPSPFQIDAAKLPAGAPRRFVGEVMIEDAGTDTYFGRVSIDDSLNTFTPFYHDVTGGLVGTFNSFVDFTSPFTFASGDEVEILCSAPIVWV